MECNPNDGPCIVCGSIAESGPVPPGHDYFHLSCEQCGEFKVSGSAVVALSRYTSPERVIKLSGWILHKNREDEIPTLESHMLEDIVTLPNPSPKERRMNLLIEMVKNLGGQVTGVDITREGRFFAATHTPRTGLKGRNEMVGLARMLEDEGLVKPNPESQAGTFRVTVKGYDLVDHLSERPLSKEAEPIDFQQPDGVSSTMKRPAEDWASRVRKLCALRGETEWVEFKKNQSNHCMIGEYISALSNSATLAGQPYAYMVWGVSDDDHAVVGTTFSPYTQKVGNAGLHIWLFGFLKPKIDFAFHEVSVDEQTVVLLRIEQAHDQPVQFKGEEYIRVGSNNKKRKDCHGKQRALWRAFVGNSQINTEAERRRAERRAKDTNYAIEPCPECNTDTYSPITSNYQSNWKCSYCNYVGPAPPTPDGIEWTNWDSPQI